MGGTPHLDFQQLFFQGVSVLRWEMNGNLLLVGPSKKSKGKWAWLAIDARDHYVRGRGIAETRPHAQIAAEAVNGYRGAQPAWG